MLSMTGVHKIIEIHRDEEAALQGFGMKRARGKADA
jgi:hypothetical protein